MIDQSNDLATCLLCECEYMDINPANFVFSDNFKMVFEAFVHEYPNVYAEPVGGFISGDKLFDIFRNIYREHYEALEEMLKMPYDTITPEVMINVYNSTFSSFLNQFHDYFTDKVRTNEGGVKKYVVSYSYLGRSLEGFLGRLEAIHHLV